MPTTKEKNMSDEQTCEATRAEIVRGAREHYEEVAKAGHAWSSSIGHALDAYEREPELKARLLALEESAAKMRAALNSLLINAVHNGSKRGSEVYMIAGFIIDKAKDAYASTPTVERGLAIQKVLMEARGVDANDGCDEGWRLRYAIRALDSKDKPVGYCRDEKCDGH